MALSLNSSEKSGTTISALKETDGSPCYGQGAPPRRLHLGAPQASLGNRPLRSSLSPWPCSTEVGMLTARSPLVCRALTEPLNLHHRPFRKLAPAWPGR